MSVTETLPAPPELVAEVWDEFAGELRAFIGRRVARREDADDILQVVALRLTQSVPDRERQTLLAWLYAVTRNAITDHYRSAARRREVPTDAFPEQLGPDPDPGLAAEDAAAAQSALAACVRPLLRLLPADQAAAVRLVDLDGVSQVEAARRAGLSVSGMKSRVQRGRRALRDAITACCAVRLDVRGAVQEVDPHGAACACSG